MNKCISKNYPFDLSFYEQHGSFRDRKRLLLMLLSRRTALRVICAPSLYGKSVLAYQYAQQVFPSDQVNWIDATEPLFLIALDAELDQDFTSRFLIQQNPPLKPQLFVIDGCPYLDDQRLETLLDLVAHLLKAGHEVILTTDDTRWCEVNEPSCQLIDAQLLLLDDRERTLWRYLDEQNANKKTSNENLRSLQPTAEKKQAQAHFSLDAIVGCRGQESVVHDRFLGMLMTSAIKTEEAALCLVMLLLGSGALHELRTYTTHFSDALLMNIERRYPHAGITAFSPMFVAAELTERDKFQLIRRHANALFRLLDPFKTEDELVEFLVATFMKREQTDLATQLVGGLHDDAKRQAFLDEHLRSFIFAGKPLALLHLTSTLPKTACTNAQHYFGVAAALKMLGESELAARLMRSFRTEDQAAEFELVTAIMEIALDIADRGDASALAQTLAETRERFAHAATEDHSMPTPSQAKPSCVSGFLAIIASTLEDPCQGHEAYQRFAAAGHSIRECACALALFLALMTFLKSPANTTKRTPREREMLAKLEQDIIYVLARQASLLPPNTLECYLFDKACALFDEQIYLHVDDQVLNRIETMRTRMSTQRDQWRAHRLTAPLINVPEDANKDPYKHPGKKALRINTFGRFEIEPHDPEVIIKNKVRKQLRLLISLMAINSGREVARPWIQRVMWPNAPDRNAKQNLYTMWSLLNRSVTTREGACPFFESYPQSLSLNTDLVETDTQLLDNICKRLRYETLEVPLYEQAIEEIEDLYRGPLLPGDDTAEVVAHRKKYQERLIEALLKGGEHLRKCGETTLALRYFRFAFENEPTREDVCYQLMLVLWKLGRHGEALSEYFVCRRALIDSFGIEGNAKLRELYETILNDAS